MADKCRKYAYLVHDRNTVQTGNLTLCHQRRFRTTYSDIAFGNNQKCLCPPAVLSPCNPEGEQRVTVWRHPQAQAEERQTADCCQIICLSSVSIVLLLMGAPYGVTPEGGWFLIPLRMSTSSMMMQMCSYGLRSYALFVIYWRNTRAFRLGSL